ncbi:NUDIX hydrolase [Marinivivus vitaminiproducens]|uniref:NUDIX hydrolase n=1 Tax=Marinivivus vitaminiproducens TaxID=3035935 RepID=UPI0027A053FE|nr:NUDIX hydrolase [Geminicoccaceae bacterium SCSIO 64248]
MRYCSACGHEVTRRVPDGDERVRFVCPSCGTVHYQNPKVVVGSVCRWQDRVLLCRRAIEPRTGFWTIPAGYLELDESTEQGALREAWEEARARIRLTGLLAVYNVVRIGQVQMLYRAELLADDVAAGPESQEVELFSWDDIPWSDLAFPTVHWVLHRARAIWDDPSPLITEGNPEADPSPTDLPQGV